MEEAVESPTRMSTEERPIRAKSARVVAENLVDIPMIGLFFEPASVLEQHPMASKETDSVPPCVYKVESTVNGTGTQTCSLY